MKNFVLAAILAIPALLLVMGCQPATSVADADFAPGAFPPIMTDTEYHADSWIREDCLTCHEEGVNDAPKTVHASLPDLAKDSKCRTCHVFIKGSKPE